MICDLFNQPDSHSFEKTGSFILYTTIILFLTDLSTVRAGGIEPPTSSLSVTRSTTELRAHVLSRLAEASLNQIGHQLFKASSADFKRKSVVS